MNNKSFSSTYSKFSTRCKSPKYFYKSNSRSNNYIMNNFQYNEKGLHSKLSNYKSKSTFNCRYPKFEEETNTKNVKININMLAYLYANESFLENKNINNSYSYLFDFYKFYDINQIFQIDSKNGDLQSVFQFYLKIFKKLVGEPLNLLKQPHLVYSLNFDGKYLNGIIIV